MEIRRVVIFGCGYVGRELAKAAVNAGWEVWIHSRNGESLTAVAEVPEERKIRANLHERDWHERLSGRWDAVVNLVSSAGGGLDGYKLSYLEGNRSILDWATGVDAKRFIYSSATSVYPQSDGSRVDEEDVPAVDQLSANGRILREAELEILESTAFTERVIARLAGIYGPGRHLYLNALRAGESALPGDGASLINLVYLKDIVSALMILMHASLPEDSGVYNIVDNLPVPKQEIVDWLADELGLPTIPFDPSLATRRATRRKSGGRLPNRRVSNEKFRKAFAWEPEFPDYRAGYRDVLTKEFPA